MKIAIFLSNVSLPEGTLLILFEYVEVRSLSLGQNRGREPMMFDRFSHPSMSLGACNFDSFPYIVSMSLRPPVSLKPLLAAKSDSRWQNGKCKCGLPKHFPHLKTAFCISRNSP